MVKKLSDKQKETIVNFFKKGKTIDELSKEFNYTKLTISRNLKKNLGEKLYKELIIKSKLAKKNFESKMKKSDFDNKYDEKIKSYEDMVRLFFELHDSTQVNRQGTYVGIQYRSEIFYANDEEKKIAEKVLDEMNKKLDGKVSTKVSKEKNYCKAEGYHQKYEKNKSLKFG